MGKKATREELGDLGVAYSRLFEFVKQGKRPARPAIIALQQLADDTYLGKPSFDRLSRQHLLSLDSQLSLLREYNEEHWGGQFTDQDFAEVFSGEDLEHVQSVEDLMLLHVDFGSPQGTVEMWWRVIRATQSGQAERFDKLQLDRKHLQLDLEHCQMYRPGIHLVHIDLAAYWNPIDGYRIEEIREQSRVSRPRQWLAQAEVLAAYGLHPTLLRQMDGRRLPQVNLLGYSSTTRGSLPDMKPFQDCPYLVWDGNRACLSSGRSVTPDNGSGAPTVWQTRK